MEWSHADEYVLLLQSETLAWLTDFCHPKMEVEIQKTCSVEVMSLRQVVEEPSAEAIGLVVPF